MTREVHIQQDTKPEESKLTNSLRVQVAKLFATTLFGLVLCSFGPFAIFAPAAFCFAHLNSDHAKAVGTQAVAFLIGYVAFGASFFVDGTGLMGVIAAIIGGLISLFIRKKFSPQFVVLNVGSLIVGAGAIILGVYVLSINGSLYDAVLTHTNNFIEQLKNNKELSQALSLGGEQAIVLKSLISSPEKIATEIVSWAPAVFISGVFLSTWASLYYVLRNSFSWRKNVEYPYGLVHFTFFKLPFSYVYAVILAICLVLLGDYVGKYASIVGMNILYILGTLYFFQGFGVCYDFFVIKKIRGFFRSFSLMIILVFAWRAVVFLGLLDVWFNFRNYFLKKNEGDK